MKTMTLGAALLLGLSTALPAAMLQDWSDVVVGSTAGVYADEKGSKVDLALVDGPAKGQKALKMSVDLAEWCGVWALAQAKDLRQAGGLRFKAKADKGAQLMLSLTDAKKIQVQAVVRVLDGGWQDFAVPMSLFKKSEWQMPEAPKDGAFDPAAVGSINLSPRAAGKNAFIVGPIEAVSGKLEGQTGMMDGSGPDGLMLVQDFEAIETGFGTFQDDKTGCKVGMKIVADPDKKGSQAGSISYDLKAGGWGGAWMRTGSSWDGQDWTGVKSLSFRVKSDSPVDLELAFNDAKQNSYTAPAVHHGGKGWETLTVPFAGFVLNPYYQPPQAKKGAPLDLSRIEAYNIGIKAVGKGSLLVDDVVLSKK